MAAESLSFLMTFAILLQGPQDRAPDSRLYFKALLENRGGVVFEFEDEDVISRCTEIINAAKDRDKKDLVAALEMRGTAFLSLGKEALGLGDLKRAMSLDATAVRSRYNYVGYLCNTNNKDAAAELEKAMELFPKESDFIVMKALYKGNLRDFEASFALFEQALRAGHRFEEVLFYRSHVHHVAQNYKRALKDIEQAIETRPYSGRFPEVPYALKGFCLIKEGRLSDALSSLALARKMNPKNKDAFHGIVTIYQKTNKPALAFALLEKSAKIEREDIEIQARYLEALNDLGYYTKADEQAAVARKLKKAHWRSVIAFGKHFIRRGEWLQALEDLSLSEYFDSDDSEATYWFALLMCSCPEDKIRGPGDANKLAKALCQKPNGMTFRNRKLLACTHAELGEFERAIEILELALKTAGLRREEIDEGRSLLELFRKRLPHRLKSGS